MMMMTFLSGYSLSSIVGVIKQLSKVVKTSGDVITMLAKDRTDNPDILAAGKMVNFSFFSDSPSYIVVVSQWHLEWALLTLFMAEGRSEFGNFTVL